MKHRLTALLLALALTASLAGCTGGDTPKDTVDPTPDATEAITLAPDTTPDPDPDVTAIPDKGTPPPEYTHHPDDHGGDDPAHHTPEVTHHPDDDHQVPAADPTPSPTPEPTPAAKSPTAKEVYDAVEKATGNSGYYDASSLVENFYNLSTGDLEEYRFAMPSMSSKLEETFVAKVKSGKLSAVKSACESRQQGLVEEAEEYLTTGDYVSSYQLVTEGDWILFYVGANAKKAVEAFQNSVK